MLQIESFEFNAFQENTYVLFDETKACVIIDPGCYTATEQTELTDYIRANELKVVMLLNTHCHIDHVLGNEYIKQTYKVGLYIHKLDLPVLKAVSAYAPNYGFHQYQEAIPDGFLDETQDVKFGKSTLKVLFVPGHAPGHVAFYCEESKLLIGGDVLFYNSIGRTDLPGGNFETLITSIRQKLYVLPDDIKVYPGHGPATTIGHEKRTNPFTQ